MSEELESMKASLRAVTEERNRLRSDLQTWKQTASTWESKATALEPLQDQIGKLQAELQSTTQRHEQDLHLTGLGISSKRARRAIRREYQAEMSETAEGTEPPAFGEFLESLKQDQAFSAWFTPAQSKPAQPAQPASQTRQPASRPNAGADQPKPPAGAMTRESYATLRRTRGRQGTQAALELLKKQGISS